jgi:cell division protein FtsL
MNAAARVINQDTLFNGQLNYMRVSKSLYMLIGLLLAVLISGFAVVYSTNAYRSTFSLMQQETLQTHHLQVQWGQLLLEQASLATPARVEEMATTHLKMLLPTNKNTYLLHSQ